MGCCGDVLYVILPYFNYCGFRKRRQLFIDFVERYRHNKQIRIVISETIGSAPLPKLKVFNHLKFEAQSPVWIKENLINLAIKKLPRDWKYMAWIDADIVFMSADWIGDAIEELQESDFVQLWHTAVNMGPCGEAMKIDKSFGYMHVKSGHSYHPSDKYGFWHPGYAWAARRSAIDHLGGLLDWAILGSADRHMALSLVGKVVNSAPGNIHPNYKVMLLEFQEACKDLKLSYVQGTIMHLWHGRIEDRKYRERWDILTKGQFDPVMDIKYAPNGMLALTKTGARLENKLIEYFIERREDS